MTDCAHHWNVTSPCPFCQQAEIERLRGQLQVIGDQYAGALTERDCLRAEVESLREAFARECDDADRLLARLGLSPGACRTDGGSLNPARAKHLLSGRLVERMVNVFLGWPLPKTFAPDCGISFDGRHDDEWNKNKTWPTGTNLFTADEARQMFTATIDAALAKDGA